MPNDPRTTHADAASRTTEAARVLIVESDTPLRSLYERTIRAGLTDAAVLSAPDDASTDENARSADVIITRAGESRRTRLEPLERLMLLQPRGRILLLVPADAPECVERAIELGASGVLLTAPGYLDQLPAWVRTNIALGQRGREQESRLSLLGAGIAEIHRDNAALRALVDRLKAAATTDPLTDLLNRRGIEERLEQVVASAARSGSDASVLMIDLDGLKDVNDALGHQSGDELLRSAGACIREQCRRGDIAGRSGGDEFIIVLPHTPAERSLVLAERIRSRFRVMAEPLQRRLDDTRRALGVVRIIGRGGRQDGTLGMTIGISSLGMGGTTTGAGLIVRADDAMYAGKRAGKDRATLYRPGVNTTPMESAAAA